MSDSLSQEEIDALLKGGADESAAAAAPPVETPDTESEVSELETDFGPAMAGPIVPIEGSLEHQDLLSGDERDALGEVGNISMASAATTLSMLLGHQVVISTPQVTIATEQEIIDQYRRPAAVVRINYTEGLAGTNVFVISTEDASIVADLMMGGSGTPSTAIMDEIQMSALGEAMNQMMGAAATAMAGMFGRRVDISAPEVSPLDLASDDVELGVVEIGDPMVAASFHLEVGDFLSTRLMQLMPVTFAKDLIGNLLSSAAPSDPVAAPEPLVEAAPVAVPPVVDAPPAPAPTPAATAAPAASTFSAPPTVGSQPSPVAPNPAPVAAPQEPPVIASSVSFPPLGDAPPQAAPGDIGLLLDVPLNVSVELGRTELRIRNVLELVPGSIIELDRLAGEPIDVLVNGKHIARGEVVVIDEEFGIRITEIASQAARLQGLAE